jgi:hypothetical protein
VIALAPWVIRQAKVNSLAIIEQFTERIAFGMAFKFGSDFLGC